jgi:hypothetical protein
LTEWSSAIVPSIEKTEPYFDALLCVIAAGDFITNTGAVLSISNARELVPDVCPALSFAVTAISYFPSGKRNPVAVSAVWLRLIDHVFPPEAVPVEYDHALVLSSVLVTVMEIDDIPLSSSHVPASVNVPFMTDDAGGYVISNVGASVSTAAPKPT